MKANKQFGDFISFGFIFASFHFIVPSASPTGVKLGITVDATNSIVFLLASGQFYKR